MAKALKPRLSEASDNFKSSLIAETLRDDATLGLEPAKIPAGGPAKEPTGQLTSEPPGGVAAVDRALMLLTCFKNGDAGLSLTELAARTGLYKSTTLRLLTSLQHARMIQKQADGNYRLGGEIARLSAVFAQSLDLEPVIVPALRQLVRLTNECAAFHVARGEGEQRMRLCLYRVECTQTIRVNVRQGEWMPVDRGTGARVLNAYASNAMPEDRLLAKVRKQGYYAASGDRKDEVGGISAPIFNATGQCIGVMTLTMPRHRYDEKWLDHVLAISSDASQALGYSA